MTSFVQRGEELGLESYLLSPNRPPASAQEGLDAIARSASLVCDVPMAYVNLHGHDCHWYMADTDLPSEVLAASTEAFDTLVAQSGQLWVMQDARTEPALAAHPLCQGAQGFRFYAGISLRQSDGGVIGTLGVLGHLPRRLDAAQAAALLDLAQVAARSVESLHAVRTAHTLRKELRQLDERFQLLSQNTRDGLIIHDLVESRVSYVSPAYARLMASSIDEEMARGVDAMFECVHPQDVDGLRGQVAALIAQRAESAVLCYRASRGRLGYFWREDVVKLMYDEAGRALKCHFLCRDVSGRKRSEQQLAYSSLHDRLTGLANRTLLGERFTGEQAGSRQPGEVSFLFVLDLDNFKDLNDASGEGVGDEVLQELAKRLTASFREVDTVARIGGDEFAIFIAPFALEAELTANYVDILAARILAEVSTPMGGRLQGLHVTCSLGMTYVGESDAQLSDVIKRAELAMHEAKQAGRNCAHLFSPEMQTRFTERLTLTHDLRVALETGGLELHYQPIIHATAHLEGYEALLRWTHPQRGPISPAVFIPIAECSGVIHDVEAWVLREACTKLAAWRRHPEKSRLSLSVNISAQGVARSDFVDKIRTVIAETGAQPERLVLEITESQLMANIEEAVDKMQALRAMGIRFALDDFGTGYSSLSLLRRLPLHRLKIDKSFVDHVHFEQTDRAVTKMIVELAALLGFAVVAEGVESIDQLAMLKEMGCNAFQGFLLGVPKPLLH